MKGSLQYFITASTKLPRLLTGVPKIDFPLKSLNYKPGEKVNMATLTTPPNSNQESPSKQ
jgi:hypothetical protein